MKLKDWADKTGVKYLTVYRWFKSGTFPVKAYQTDSGTIIVEDPELSDNSANINDHTEALPLFVQKTAEFSNNNSSVTDFAAYVLSNFSLKLNSSVNSKIKPKSEDIKYKQILKSQEAKLDSSSPNHAKVYGAVNVLNNYDDIYKNAHSFVDKLTGTISAMCPMPLNTITNGIPTNINQVMGADNILGDNPLSMSVHAPIIGFEPAYTMSNSAFQPTQEKIDVAHASMEKMINGFRASLSKSKRGRKPSKKRRTNV